MGSQNIGDRRVANLIADFGKLPLNPVESPSWILSGELQSQINDHLADSWPSLFFLPSIRIVPFPGDQLTVPAQDRVRREQRAALFKLLATEHLSLDGQSAALVIVEQDAFLAKSLFENSVLGAQILNHLLLLSIDPASNDQQQQMPWL